MSIIYPYPSVSIPGTAAVRREQDAKLIPEQPAVIFRLLQDREIKPLDNARINVRLETFQHLATASLHRLGAPEIKPLYPALLLRPVPSPAFDLVADIRITINPLPFDMEIVTIRGIDGGIFGSEYNDSVNGGQFGQEYMDGADAGGFT